jgi:hypothetical protein
MLCIIGDADCHLDGPFQLDNIFLTSFSSDLCTPRAEFQVRKVSQPTVILMHPTSYLARPSSRKSTKNELNYADLELFSYARFADID